MNNFIPVYSDPQYQQPPQRASMKVWPLVIVIAVVSLGVAGFVWRERIPFLTAQIVSVVPSSTQYQAVFLSSGQVYFGKLELKQGWLVLKDVYYLQVDDGSVQTAADGSNFQLVKLGSEIHGPEDVMYIDVGNVLFWENMRDDSQVLQAIQQAKK